MTVMVATIAAGSVSLASPGIASTGHTLQQCGTKPWPCHLPLSPSPPAPAQNIAALLHWVSSTQDRGCPSHALVRGWPSHVLDRDCHSHAHDGAAAINHRAWQKHTLYIVSDS